MNDLTDKAVSIGFSYTAIQNDFRENSIIVLTIVYHYWYTIVMSYYNIIYEYAADNYGLITSEKAKEMGVPNVELVKLAHRGRLVHVGHGVYRIIHYIPTFYDRYAEAIAMVGDDAVVYAESVLAMHNLAFVNPPAITVALRRRNRKKLPSYINVVNPDKPYSVTEYEGIPSQCVYEALIVCKNLVMTERLREATDESERLGLISVFEAIDVRSGLNERKNA